MAGQKVDLVTPPVPVVSRPLKTGANFVLVLPKKRFVYRHWDKEKYLPGEEGELILEGEGLDKGPYDFVLEKSMNLDGNGPWVEVTTLKAKVSGDKATAKFKFPTPPPHGHITKVEWKRDNAKPGDRLGLHVETEGYDNGAWLSVHVEKQNPDSGEWEVYTRWQGELEANKYDSVFPIPPNPDKQPGWKNGSVTEVEWASGKPHDGETVWLRAKTDGLEGSHVEFVLERADDSGEWHEIGSAVATVKDDEAEPGIPVPPLVRTEPAGGGEQGPEGTVPVRFSHPLYRNGEELVVWVDPRWLKGEKFEVTMERRKLGDEPSEWEEIAVVEAEPVAAKAGSGEAPEEESGAEAWGDAAEGHRDDDAYSEVGSEESSSSSSEENAADGVDHETSVSDEEGTPGAEESSSGSEESSSEEESSQEAYEESADEQDGKRDDDAYSEVGDSEQHSESEAEEGRGENVADGVDHETTVVDEEGTPGAPSNSPPPSGSGGTTTTPGGTGGPPPLGGSGTPPSGSGSGTPASGGGGTTPSPSAGGTSSSPGGGSGGAQAGGGTTGAGGGLGGSSGGAGAGGAGSGGGLGGGGASGSGGPGAGGGGAGGSGGSGGSGAGGSGAGGSGAGGPAGSGGVGGAGGGAHTSAGGGSGAGPATSAAGAQSRGDQGGGGISTAEGAGILGGIGAVAATAGTVAATGKDAKEKADDAEKNGNDSAKIDE